jgi:Domain of unknown function (DUF4263)
MQNPALLRLYDALGEHLAVAEHEVGNYVVIKTDGSVGGLGDVNVGQIAAAIGQLLNSEGITEHLRSIDLGAEVVHALRTELRLREIRGAVADLTNNLREGVADEQVYQRWCEDHSWAFGNAYVVNDQLRSISATDKIDLLLPRHLGGFRDLIELKRPDKSLLVWDTAHSNYYFSSDVSAAIGQCHRYLDVLHTEVGRGGLRDAPEVIGYHPRATVVIGRSNEWQYDKQAALHGLNCRLADISIMTYDHLLAQARRTLELVEAPDAEPEMIVPPDSDPWNVDDFGEQPF